MSLWSLPHLVQFGKAVLTRRAPVYCQFVVTNRCPNACLYCNAPRSRPGEAELSLDEIRAVADRLARLGVVFLVITGGEPFLRPDLEEIVRAFAEKGLVTRIQTTGIGATDERIRAMFDAGLSDFSVSIDTLKPALQDTLCGRPGSMDAILAALASILTHQPAKSILTGANIVVSRANLTEIPNLVAFCTYFGLTSSVIPLHQACKTEGSYLIRKSEPERGNGIRLGFEPEDEGELREVFSLLAEMKRRGHPVHDSTWFLSHAADYLLRRPVHWKCESPNLYFSISSSGRVLPCVDRNEDAGPLDERFVETFRRGEIRDRLAASVAACDGCFYACYPEFSRLVRNPATMLERMRHSRTVRTRVNRRYSAEELNRIAGWFAGLDREAASSPPGVLARSVPR